MLDACRYDFFCSVSDSIEWVPNELRLSHSLGSDSIDWMENDLQTTDEELLSNTIYVTGNPFSHEYAPKERLLNTDEVWRYGWDNDQGTVPADVITDRAIYHGRETKAERIIVHYMQPHFPSIPNSLGFQMDIEQFGEESVPVWDAIREGRVSKERAKDAYLANLRYVLNWVEKLKDNIDANKLVITADHGEAFGEWGELGHSHKPIPILRRVPWVELSASDSGQFSPTIEPHEGDSDIKRRLQSLGYLQ